MKKTLAAIGAAFLLLALIPAVRVKAAASFTQMFNVWLLGSKIDSSPIGSSFPSTGSFTTLNSTGGTLNGSIGSTTPAAGSFTTISASGTITGTNNWSTSGSIGSTGGFSGNLNGNANTATALASAPSTCGSGLGSIGIAANGNANCQPVMRASVVMLHDVTLCTPSTSTDSQCSGSVTYGTSFADTSYGVATQVFNTDGAQLYLTVTAKTTTQFNYNLTCTFFCGIITSVKTDVLAFHP